MAHGSVSYTKANHGNLGKWVGDKIKSAASMAAEERKYAKEQAEKQRKEGVPEEEIKKPGKGYFFGKALSHEFGGDLLRRTKGTFSNDPSDTEDPALTKQQRFSNLIRGESVVTPQPYKQLELDLNGTGKGADGKEVNVEDKKLKSWLTVAFDGIEKSYQTIADKLTGLSNKEKESSDEQVKTTTVVSKITSGLSTVKNFFNKNNKLKQEENKTESQQLEFNFDQANAEEMQQKESDLEKGSDLSSVMSVEDPYAQDDEEEGSDGNRGNMFGRMFDFDLPGRRGRMRRGAKRRLARRKFNNFKRGLGRRTTRLRRRGQVGFGRALKRFKMSEGGVVSPSVSTNNINQSSTSTNNINQSATTNIDTPAAVNNVQPLAKIVEPKPTLKPQSNVKSQTKLSRGGIVDNPTNTLLSPGQSVIPLNRNNPLKNIFRQQKEQNQPGKKDSAGKTMGENLAKALQLPAQAAGGLLLSIMSSVFKRLGGIGKLVAPFLTQLFTPLARVFGLPAAVVGSLLGGGEASAATMDMKGIADFLGGGKPPKKAKAKGGGGGGGGSNPPGATPGSLMADLEADVGKGASDMKDEIIASGATGTVDPTQQPWCAAYVNSQLKRNGIQGSGSAMADSFLNWGTPVDKQQIQPGDVIVGDYGGGSRTHVMFAAGTPKDGYVDIIGGNQSGKVTKGSIALSKIDGVRRATTGQVTSPSLARTPVQNTPQPAKQPVKPNQKLTKQQAQQAATNILLGKGFSSTASSPSTLSPIGATSALTLSTRSPVAPNYYNPW